MFDMNCEEFWNTAPPAARDLDGPHGVHVRDCPTCAARWKAECDLSAGLREIAKAWTPVEAPARVEFRLVQEFRSHFGTNTYGARPMRQPWIAALAWTTAAATLAIALLLVRDRPPQPPKPTRVSATQLAVAEPAENVGAGENGFIPLANEAGVAENADNEDTDLVRLEVPRSAMMALGYTVSPDRAAERVQAEVILGPDGQARAVRFLDE